MNKIKCLTLISTFLFSVSSNLYATEIFIADISKANSSYQLGNITNITKRAGYDNQPSFSNDKPGVYYTAMSNDGPTNTQTDIMYYDMTSGSTIQVTNTKNISEYSPTHISNENAVSMIIVEQDGTQRLWKTTLNDNNQTSTQHLINEFIKPVGYHAWGKNQDLLLFVLGNTEKNEPMMLRYLTNKTKKVSTLIDVNIGRAIHFNQTLNLFSYTKEIDNEHVLQSFNQDSGQTQAHTKLPKNSQDYVWLNQDSIISASGSTIYQWHFDVKNEAQKAKPSDKNTWQLFAELKEQCPTQITRLAVNNSQTKLAFVCDES